MPKLVNRDQFFSAIETMFGNIDSISRADIIRVCEANDINWPAWFVNDAKNRIGRGVYALKSNSAVTEKFPVAANTRKKLEKMSIDDDLSVAAMAVSAVQLNVGSSVDFIPKKSVGYVPFGNFSDVRQIIKSGKFYPMYITGLSGNGKTMMIEQVCAVEKREMVRVNITIETDEDDLIGGFRLVDGRTVWQNGPAIVAMERGAVLLLDEVDLGSNKLMCLQPILEGKPVYIKKINKLITPVSGFTVVATANTKGKGSDDGRFIGTNVMNEAFLERFSITMEQEYPNVKIEQKILNNVLAASGIEDVNFTDKLVQWADVIRKSFYDGALSDIISTRRLVHICEAYSIFNQNREKSVTLCLNRFDIDTKNSFLDLYKKLDETVISKSATTYSVSSSEEEIAF